MSLKLSPMQPEIRNPKSSSMQPEIRKRLRPRQRPRHAYLVLPGSQPQAIPRSLFRQLTAAGFLIQLQPGFASPAPGLTCYYSKVDQTAHFQPLKRSLLPTGHYKEWSIPSCINVLLRKAAIYNTAHPTHKDLKLDYTPSLRQVLGW
jgi:hypothetical protein